ncbi:MAG: hypothetical protein Q8Q50_09715 [Methylobacter sp.]|nr:hypothetical protein [Methylobacter sp.]
MRTNAYKKHSRGIGLIEVLITTVVVALGLLATASMQGGFMSESATNKTRAEGMVLAEQKIEELRNYVTRGQFPVAATNPVTDTVTGSNATFTRSWQITQISGAAPATPRIGLNVSVSWGANADQQVALTSQIGYVEASNTAGLGSGSGELSHLTGPGIGSPSPNEKASERALDVIKPFEANGTTLKSGYTSLGGNLITETATGKMYRLDGGGALTARLVEYKAGLNPFDIDLRYEVNNATPAPTTPIRLYTKRVNLDNVAGNETIQLYTDNMVGGIGDGQNMLDLATMPTPDGTATLVHRFRGGVVLSVAGTVHTTNNLDDIEIDYNREDMYCVYNQGNGVQQRPYVCYTGGNCNGSTAGAGYTTTIPSGTNDSTTCLNPPVADAIVGLGGWRGNIGPINLNDTGGNKESVCFLEEILANPNPSPASTARKYKGMYNGVEQGINRSYSCQDFLIVSRFNTFTKLAAGCAIAASKLGVTSLPGKTVSRTNANTVDGIDNTTYCNNLATKNYTLTVTVTNGVSGTVVKALGGLADVTCAPDLTYTTYSCSGTTKANVLTASATTPSGTSGDCTATLTGSPNLTGSCSLTLATPPRYILNGTITGTNQAPNVTATDGIMSTPISCTSTTTTFSCDISTNYNNVTFTGEKKGNKTPYCTVGITGSVGSQTTLNSVCVLQY